MQIKDLVKKLLTLDQEMFVVRSDNSGGLEHVYQVYESTVVKNFPSEEKGQRMKVVVMGE